MESVRESGGGCPLAANSNIVFVFIIIQKYLAGHQREGWEREWWWWLSIGG